MRKSYCMYLGLEKTLNSVIELLGHDPQIERISVMHFEWITEEEAIDSNLNVKHLFEFNHKTTVYDQMEFYSKLFPHGKLWFESLARYRLKYLMQKHNKFYLTKLYMIAHYERTGAKIMEYVVKPIH